MALALLLAFLLLVDPASGLFGFGKKKKETDEAAAKAGLEESLAAAELSRKKKDSKKAAEPPKKPKPAAAVSARKVRLTSWMGRTCVWLCEERCCCPHVCGVYLFHLHPPHARLGSRATTFVVARKDP